MKLTRIKYIKQSSSVSSSTDASSLCHQLQALAVKSLVCIIDSCTQELRNSIGVTSHPVAHLLPRKVLQSIEKSAGGWFEVCGWLNFSHHTI